MPICGRQSLCLSIVDYGNGTFSVMATELSDESGNPIPAEACLDSNNSAKVVSNLLPEYGNWIGNNLEELIRKAAKELYKILS